MSRENFDSGMKVIFEMDIIPLDTILKEKLDSLGIAEIITCAEDELSIQLSNAQVLEIKTFGDLLTFIDSSVK
jgi:acyl carrier protein